MKWLDKIEPKSLVHGRTRSMYFPLGFADDKERAYEEARLLRRLGYKAQVWQHNNHSGNVKYIVMVGHQYLYNASGK